MRSGRFGCGGVIGGVLRGMINRIKRDTLFNMGRVSRSRMLLAGELYKIVHPKTGEIERSMPSIFGCSRRHSPRMLKIIWIF
jgi:hypothetical protein